MHTLDKSVVLIGHMGAGKTSLGPRIARALSLPFIDSDSRIVAETGHSIASIFATKGETAFRQLEYALLKRLLAGETVVIAAGGGMFIHDPNRALIQTQAISLWLRANLSILAKRISQGLGDKKANPRPLLAGKNVRATLTKLAEVRDPIYGTADIIVDTDDCKLGQTVARVVAALAQHQSPSQKPPHQQRQSA